MTRFFLFQRTLSWLFRIITRVEWRWFKNTFITVFAKLYHVNWDECVRQSPTNYRNFNDFFTREIKKDMRPISNAAIVSPSDGKIAAYGQLRGTKFIQAKGHEFTLETLITDPTLAKSFKEGNFATIYLSPKNYHRLHMPIDGKLLQTIHIPGKLYSVSLKTSEKIPSLFAENERLISLFETEVGKVIVILVGAVNVSSIETVWDGVITPPYGKMINYKNHEDSEIFLKKGEEFGRFNMGSTAIVITQNHHLSFPESFSLLQPIAFGEALLMKTNPQDLSIES